MINLKEAENWRLRLKQDIEEFQGLKKGAGKGCGPREASGTSKSRGSERGSEMKAWRWVPLRFRLQRLSWRHRRGTKYKSFLFYATFSPQTGP